MNIEDIKSYSDVLQYIAEQQPEKNLKEIAKDMDISEKSFHEVKKNNTPGPNVKRKLQGYMSHNYNLSIKEVSDGNIQVTKEIHVEYFSGNMYLGSGAAANAAGKEGEETKLSNKLSYLLEKLIERETSERLKDEEIKLLKRELEKLKRELLDQKTFKQRKEGS